MQIVRPSSVAAWRRLSIEHAWAACDPWEKFRRATSIPTCISSRSAGSVRQDGPMVQMIFARRLDGTATTGGGWGRFSLMEICGADIVTGKASLVVGQQHKTVVGRHTTNSHWPFLAAFS